MSEIAASTDTVLTPVTQEEVKGAQTETTEVKTEEAKPEEKAEEKDLEQAHYHRWCNARAEHIEEVAQVARSRINSLETTQAARLALLEEQHNNATDSRIRRMRESQIETAKRDYERRADELKRAAQQGDIIAEAIVFGVLVAEGANDQGS